MDAMILAAGLGTRLRPLTESLPKALVPVGGTPMLEHVARRLIAAGADRLIINTHPFPDMIREFVRERGDFGVDVVFSHEAERPLDTGGALRHARELFRRDAPFLLHNCDVFTDIDLRALVAAHASSDAIATLAVLPPSAERYLVFDDDGLLGYAPRGGGEEVRAREPRGTEVRHDFSGIHVIDAALLDTLPDQEVFSIVLHYLALARRGVRVGRCPQPGASWIDIGTPNKLYEADRQARQSVQ